MSVLNHVKKCSLVHSENEPGIVKQGSLQRKGHVPLTQQAMLRWIVNDGMADGLFVSAGEVMAH